MTTQEQLTDIATYTYKTQSLLHLTEDKDGFDPIHDDFHAELFKYAYPKAKIYNEVMTKYNGKPLGIEFQYGNDGRYALVIPDASEPGKYRVSNFDKHGFSGHQTYDTIEKAVQEMLQDGYRIEARGMLSELSKQPEFAIGNQVSTLIGELNSGKITHTEFNDKRQAVYDAVEKEKIMEAQAQSQTLDPAAQKYLDDRQRHNDAADEHNRLRRVGQEALPGIRFADAAEVGRVWEMKTKGDLTEAEWDSYKNQLISENRVKVMTREDYEKRPPYDEDYTGPRYKYGFRNRPYSFATCPKGSILMTYKPEDKEYGSRHGTIEYPFELTPKDVYDYELIDFQKQMKPEDKIKSLALTIAKSNTELSYNEISDSTGLSQTDIDDHWIAANSIARVSLKRSEQHNGNTEYKDIEYEINLNTHLYIQGPLQVIYSQSESNTKNEPVFWSTAQGWSSLDKATTYTKDEIKAINLPGPDGVAMTYKNAVKHTLTNKEPIMSDTMEKLQGSIETIIKERFPESFVRTSVSTLGGEHRPSLTVGFALGKDKNEWPNGIIQNDPAHTVFLVHTKRDKDGAISNLELAGSIYGYYQSGKSDKAGWRDIKKPTDIDGVLKNVTKYFDNMKAIHQEKTQTSSQETITNERTYEVTFNGVPKDTIGVSTTHSETLKATDKNDAIVRLHDKYDHICMAVVRDIEPFKLPVPMGKEDRINYLNTVYKMHKTFPTAADNENLNTLCQVAHDMSQQAHKHNHGQLSTEKFNQYADAHEKTVKEIVKELPGTRGDLDFERGKLQLHTKAATITIPPIPIMAMKQAQEPAPVHQQTQGHKR